MNPTDMSPNGFIKRQLSRTSAFVAEYVVYLLSLGTVLGNLIWLVFIFFGLIIAAMNGGQTASYISTQLIALWLVVSSLVSMPLAALLWSRTQGELTTNHELKGELPKGGAKGFRTFWIVVAFLLTVGLKVAAIYAPLAAWSAGGPVGTTLLSVTLPALISVAILYAGIYMVTRSVSLRKKVKIMMLGVAALTIVLFVTDYLWSHNMPVVQPPVPVYSSPVYPDPYANPTINY